MKTEYGIGIAGFGTVGQGVWKHLRGRGALLSERAGADLVPVVAAARDLTKRRAVRIGKRQLLADAHAVATDPRVDIFCELMGGVEAARAVVTAALEAGKVVVTANKALLCEHGAELFALAAARGTRIHFEASVAGGIPIIKALSEGLVANRFPLMYGILNGTCNYILTRMERERQPFSAIVEDARRLGYVEADESLDLDGWDAAHKAVILTWLAHGKWVPLNQMVVKGIRDVALEDIEWAERLGYKIKLLAIILRDVERGHVFTSVQPALVPKGMVLANVDDVFNAVSVTGDVVGESVYIGRGAGQDATASAVLSDLVDAVVGLRSGQQRPQRPERDLSVARLADIRRAFYVRLRVKDRPGVLAELASLLSQFNISIENLLQRPDGGSGSAHLILTTHTTTEAAMQDATRAMSKLPSVLKKPFLLRIADFEQSIS